MDWSAGLVLGKSWLSAMLLSIAASLLFAEIFSVLIGTGFLMGFGIFLAVLLSFLGVIMYAGRGRETENERIRQLAAFRSLQAGDLRKDDDL
jgi:predicted membrane protein